MKRNIKKVARFIMEFILATSIIAFVLIHIISSTILQKTYVLSSFNKVDYYNRIYELVESNFAKYIQQSGLKEDVLKGIITKEKIKEDTKKIIVNIYDGFFEEVTTTEISEKLKKNINDSLDNRDLSDEEEESIDVFIEQICNEYKESISYMQFENQINQGYKKIIKYVNLANKIAVSVMGVSAIILVLLNLRRFYRIGTNYGIAILAAGVFLIICNIYITSNLDIKYLTIFNDPISDIVRNVVGDIFANILKDGIILTILGVVLIFVSNIGHNISKYRLKSDSQQEN